MTGPLAGIRVIDLTTYVPGPFASRVLCDFGADVVQIEQAAGDPARHVEPRIGEDSALHAWLGQGKSSRVLDLKSEQGLADLFALVAEADIAIEGFSPGVAARLGVDYDALQAVRPGLIYCSISGNGQSGEFAATPAHDIDFVARSGLLDQIRGSDGAPATVGPILGDMAGSLFAVSGILAALVHQRATGKGQFVDVPLLGAAIAFAGPQLVKSMAGRDPAPDWDLNSGANPGYRVYETRDRGHLAVGALEDKFWRRLCHLLERDDLGDRRATDPAAVVEELATLFASNDRDHWVALLGDADVCVAPVNTLREVRDDPHVGAGEFLVDGAISGTWFPGTPVRFSATPIAPGSAAPSLGSSAEGRHD